MRVITKPHEWKAWCKSHGGKLGFVPTMGALHAGHLALVKQGLDDHGACGVSIFVNPTQFNDPKDLEKYPRTLEADCALLADLIPGLDPLPRIDPPSVSAPHGVPEDSLAVFAPVYDDLYPDGFAVKVMEHEWASLYCGAHRPGHFDGVLSVVLKLLNLSCAGTAYFGEKDYQQYLLIDRMAKAYFLDTAIVPCPIVREGDGLAMSSRNVRLTKEGRALAPEIHRALVGDCVGFATSTGRERAKAAMVEHGIEVEYLEDWYPHGPSEPGRRLVAAWIDGVRVIDNIPLPPQPKERT